MDFFDQNFFGPNIFLTKTTSMNTTTTTIKMGFDTIKINLVLFGGQLPSCELNLFHEDPCKAGYLAWLSFEITFGKNFHGQISHWTRVYVIG